MSKVWICVSLTLAVWGVIGPLYLLQQVSSCQMNAAGSGDSGGIGQKSPAPPSQSRPLVYAANSCEIVVVGGNKENDNYGAWPVCTNLLPPNPLVYSFGIGGDISFDVAMVSDFHARAVFCYDPTIDEESFATLSNAKDANLSFSQIGLGASNKVIHFYKSRNPKIGSMVSTPGLKGYHTDPFLTAPVHDIATLAAINGHTWIDLIKLDVEGGEFEVFLQSDISSLPTSQILIEFHARFFDEGQARQSAVYKLFAEAGWELAYEQPKRKEETVFIRTDLPNHLE